MSYARARLRRMQASAGKMAAVFNVIRACEVATMHAWHRKLHLLLQCHTRVRGCGPIYVNKFFVLCAYGIEDKGYRDMGNDTPE